MGLAEQGQSGGRAWLRFFIWIGLCFYSALVLQLMWRWHVVKFFHAEPLPYGQALGLLVLLGWLKFRTPYKHEETRDDALVWGAVLNTLLLGLSWLGAQL